MGVKYIYDESGKVESVILPIDYWKDIEKKVLQNDSPNEIDVDSFQGFLNFTKEEVEKVSNKMRDEWKRDI